MLLVLLWPSLSIYSVWLAWLLLVFLVQPKVLTETLQTITKRTKAPVHVAFLHIISALLARGIWSATKCTGGLALYL